MLPHRPASHFARSGFESNEPSPSHLQKLDDRRRWAAEVNGTFGPNGWCDLLRTPTLRLRCIFAIPAIWTFAKTAQEKAAQRRVSFCLSPSATRRRPTLPIRIGAIDHPAVRCGRGRIASRNLAPIAAIWKGRWSHRSGGDNRPLLSSPLWRH